MELTEFLLARYAEEEAAAGRASGGPWSEANEGAPGDPDAYTIRDAAGWSLGGERFSATDAKHIAHWDPARVLVEVEAKRRIVADGPSPCVNGRDEEGHYNGRQEVDANLRGLTCRECVWAAAQTLQWEFALQCLALPYADHADYLAEWKP